MASFTRHFHTVAMLAAVAFLQATMSTSCCSAADASAVDASVFHQQQPQGKRIRGGVRPTAPLPELSNTRALDNGRRTGEYVEDLPPAAAAALVSRKARSLLSPRRKLSKKEGYYEENLHNTQEDAVLGEPSPSSPIATTNMPSSAPTTITTTTTSSSPQAAVEVVPTEEPSKSYRALLPFSLEISGTTFEETNDKDDNIIDQVLQMYLYERLSIPFSNLEGIHLNVTTGSSSNENKRRNRWLLETKYDFTGQAVFLESPNDDDPNNTNTIPTEEKVQKEQLKALQDFYLLRHFVISQGYTDWEPSTVIVDGMTFNEDGVIPVPPDHELEEDKDATAAAAVVVQGADDGGSVSSSGSQRGVVISLSLLLFGLVGIFAYRKTHHWRNNRERTQSPDVAKTDSIQGKNTSFTTTTASTTIEAKSFDSSMNVSSASENASSESPSSTVPPAAIDWNRVFALSQQIPVEQTYGQEVFEPKSILPPKAHTTHELVTLAPVMEGMDTEEDVIVPPQTILPGDNEDEDDSYGYNSMDLNEGINEDFILSSPLVPGTATGGGTANANYGEANDLTIDLADFLPGGDLADFVPDEEEFSP